MNFDSPVTINDIFDSPVTINDMNDMRHNVPHNTNRSIGGCVKRLFRAATSIAASAYKRI